MASAALNLIVYNLTKKKKKKAWMKMALTASPIQLSHVWAVDGTSSTGMTPEGGFKRDLPPKLKLTSWWTWWGRSDESGANKARRLRLFGTRRRIISTGTQCVQHRQRQNIWCWLSQLVDSPEAHWSVSEPSWRKSQKAECQPTSCLPLEITWIQACILQNKSKHDFRQSHQDAGWR